ncbi:hypothetical protein YASMINEVIRUS_1193 [Yasminevirus sp. GU-2018]|uniref:Uncharacterized protein n=1 Tax=Yasminevirus sp. GU-2018 TaxID=2420051 RepID=A0A5K0UAV1_9VIRU|nr:hypothetical protein YASMINEVIRUS_1193 [Yasminevirus sp. GU-2018]
MDKIGAVLLIAILALCYLFFFGGSKSSTSSNEAECKEGMAPLDAGTYENNYPRGRCRKGSMKRTSCEIGNCPLGTTVTNERFCGIQCAQDPDPESRQQCYDYCMNMMKGGCE